MKGSLLTAFVVFCFLFSFVAGAPVFEVVKANSRTFVVPDDYSTISLALEHAVDGDVIFVKAGTYREVLTINKAVSLIGEAKESTIINGNGSGTVILVRHDNVTITGFSVVYTSIPHVPQSIWMWSTRLAGIHLLSVKNCTVYNNKVSDCGGGIWLYDAHQNTVSNNTVVNNDYGIRVEASTCNTITNNTVTGNWGGIRLISTSANTLLENILDDNEQGFGILNEKLAFEPDNVDSSNKIDGKPIYYWVGLYNKSVPSNASYVVLVNCTNIAITGLCLSKNQEGIIMAGTINSTVKQNSINDVITGITLFDSFLDRIINNDIDANICISANGIGTQISDNSLLAYNTGISTNGTYQTVAGNAIRISGMNGGVLLKISGSYTNVTKNTMIGTSYVNAIIEGPENLIYKNTLTDSYGLRVTSDANLITQNFVNGGSLSVTGSSNVVCLNTLVNGFGLTVAGHYNTYYANQVQNSTVGADVGGADSFSSDNKIFQNNFIDNREQIQNYDNKANFWDNGFEGNYWSDYNGTDDNGDGIGDTPYLIPGQFLDHDLRKLVPIITGQDNYPLINLFNINSIIVQLPQWQLNLTFSIPQTTPSPIITPTTPSTQEPTTTPPSTSPSTSPTLTSLDQASQLPQSTPQLFSTKNLYLTIVALATCTIIVAIIAILRKNKTTKKQNKLKKPI
ncbi:MAG: hypothetical protein GX638_15490 [Crenarchaeota archaeon]|nr:hypothetical protein [Thermoproteota archaeon]